MAALGACFRDVRLFANLWIPAFAGMTGAKTNFETYPCKPFTGEG